MDALAALESIKSSPDLSKLPLNMPFQSSQSPIFPIDFSLSSRAASFLEPRVELPQKHWEWSPHLSLHTLPTQCPTSFLFKRNLVDGSFDMSEFTEVEIVKSEKATNSTSITREPGSNLDYVRGKNTFYPFAPGITNF
jgi:hypothetical protein